SSRALAVLHLFPPRRSSDLFVVAPIHLVHAIGEVAIEPAVIGVDPNRLRLTDGEDGPRAEIAPRRIVGKRQAPATTPGLATGRRSEEHTSELQSRENLVCRL